MQRVVKDQKLNVYARHDIYKGQSYLFLLSLYAELITE
jgi:hypothetical protein